MLHLKTGALITYDYLSEPFLIYGKIYSLWSDLGGTRSGLGHPLADPKILSNGATCSIFVGGHVHQSGNRDAELLSLPLLFFLSVDGEALKHCLDRTFSVPATKCNAENQPTVPEAVWEGSDYWVCLAFPRRVPVPLSPFPLLMHISYTQPPLWRNKWISLSTQRFVSFHSLTFLASQRLP
jgi:hypothetical protein